MVHMIVITKVSAGEASEQRDYESWSCALVPMSDDGVWSVDAPCMAHTSVVVLPADSEEYKKFVEMWLGAIFCSGFWKLLSTMGQEESQTNFIGMAQWLLQSCSDITAEKAPAHFFPLLQNVLRVFIALRGLVLGKPGACGLSDVQYVFQATQMTLRLAMTFQNMARLLYRPLEPTWRNGGQASSRSSSKPSVQLRWPRAITTSVSLTLTPWRT